ncbi:MAG: SirB2 family protein [Sphingobacteriales bacterium]|nr:MAG: SirB2 family protein [Sphingobacteriales bacterium]
MGTFGPDFVKHLHLATVILFLLSYLAKTVLLFLDETRALENYKKKTIATEGVISLVFLITGIYILTTYGGAWMKVNGWFHVKLTLVILALPLGFIGFKRRNKWMAGLSTLMFLVVFILALIKGSSNYF